MKQTNLNIMVTGDSSIYMNDIRLKWIYENLYGQYGKNIEVKLENNKVVIYGSIMIPHEYDEIPVKIDEIYGSVIIDNYNTYSQGNLQSLKNFPTIIHGDFKCKSNKYLTSLKNGPEIVDGDFICVGCGLTSIEYMPKKIGGNFYVYKNNIKELTPLLESTINGSIDVEFNPCENIKFTKDINKQVKIENK